MSEQACLAEVVYREARGEPFLGKVAVAHVAINRTKNHKFPKTVCRVINQPGQFPWATAGYKPSADKESYTIAKMVMDGDLKLDNFDALYFHSKHVNPKWKLNKVATIANHVFYKDKL